MTAGKDGAPREGSLILLHTTVDHADPSATPVRGTDAECFAWLNSSFRPGLVRYFRRRVRDQADIDDLIQDVFLRLVRRGGVRDLQEIGGYVFQTASSVVNDWLRGRRSHHVKQHESFDAERHADVDFAADRVLEGKERLHHATLALLELPERTRNVFVLRRIEGMRYGEIAQRLGLSVSAVEKHVQRAMAHLMARLGDQ